MRRRTSIASNPVLIGAATVLVVVVAVFLAYNANSGLPFVPSYTVKATVPNAAALVVGNDVRIAGTRIGTITAITPEQNPRTGKVVARVTLKLDKSVEPLPIDSTVIVRARSALGLKYVQITKGTSPKGWPDNAVIPLRQARPQPVEIDEVFSMFDKDTREASEVNLTTFSQALAGRGQDLNDTIATLPRLLTNLGPVMRNLSSPSTGLSRFIQALAQTAGAVAPVAQQQAGWFAGLDATFSALASIARPYLQDTISEGPETLRVATDSFRHQAAFLDKTTRFFTELQPATSALVVAAPPLGNAVESGAPVLTAAVGLNERLDDVLGAFAEFGQDDEALAGVSDLASTAKAALPLISALEGMQRICNYPALFLRNISSALSAGDSVGNWLRIVPILPPVGPNNEGGPSSQPADGPSIDNHLHSNPVPNTAQPGQTQECEAGNEYYSVGDTTLGNLPGNQGQNTDWSTNKLGSDGFGTKVPPPSWGNTP